MAQVLYWTESEGIRRMVLPDGEMETLILKNYAPYAHGVAVDPDEGHLYWTTGSFRTIERSDLDGSNVVRLVELPSSGPGGIALDTSAGKMYWTAGKIQRANLDGSDVEDVVAMPASAAAALALDLSEGKLYWTDPLADVIRRSNLDGSDVETVIDTQLPSPRGIALDLIHGKMYWTDLGKVERANLDGSARELVSNIVNMEPRGIVVDPIDEKIYWLDDRFGQKALRYADLDGGNAGVHVSISYGFVSGLALDVVDGRLYWSNYGERTIYSATVDGSEIDNVFSSAIHVPQGIGLDLGRGNLHWTDTGFIGIAKLSGLDPVKVTTSPCRSCEASRQVAIDPSTDRMYWFYDYSDHWLKRSRLNGTEQEVVLMLPSPTRGSGLAIDPYDGHLYTSFKAYPDIGVVRRARLAAR
jgi:DNA-binding beta-propeller fold protein YncE